MTRLTPLLNEPACPTCAHTIAPFAAPDGKCPNCRSRPWPLDGAIRLFPYRDIARDLVRRIKFHNQIAVLTQLSKQLADRLKKAPWISEIDAFVGVPTCWTHRVSLPYHLAAILNRQLARRLRIPPVPVLRRRKGPKQVGLSASDRERNVAGKFFLRPGAIVQDAHICLVDDVMTTGSTVNACARALKKSGAKQVFAAVLATAFTQPTTPRKQPTTPQK